MRMGIGLGVGINRSNYAQGIFGAYATRVVADGGVVESGTCVDAVSSLLQSASLLLIPSGYKGGKLYAEIPTNGNGDLTWTRGGDAFRTNASGVLQRVPWNLVQYSEDFTNGVWLKTNSSVSGNVTIAPNGTLTADKLVENSTNANHYTNQSVTNTNSLITYSIYAKASERNFLYVSAFATLPNNFGYVPSAYFDLTNGTLGTTSGCNASIVNVGNGWFRCIIQCTSVFASSSATVTFYNYTATANGINSYQGDGTSGIFIWGAQLVEGTTAQTYLPTTDRLNFPRLSYMYGSCPSALVEPQRTNLVLQSDAFDNASWLKLLSSVTANQTTSPDGTTNADKLFENATNGFHSIYQSTSNATGLFTLSCYAKSSERNWLILDIFTGASGGDCLAWFDLNNGVVGSTTNGSGSSSTTSTIQSVGNGWYRCSVTVNKTSATGGNSSIAITTGNNITSYAGNSSNGLFIYGAQLEAGAYPTTYIPTTNATATRVADSFSRNNIYTNGLISASGGTWFVEFRNNVAYLGDAAGDNIILGVSTLVSDNCIRFNSPFSSSSRIAIAKRIGGVTTVLYTTTTNTCKIAIKWDGSVLDIFENGVKVVSGSSFTEKNMEFLSNGSNAAPKFIQQMALFPTPLTDTQCQTLTT